MLPPALSVAERPRRRPPHPILHHGLALLLCAPGVTACDAAVPKAQVTIPKPAVLPPPVDTVDPRSATIVAVTKPEHLVLDGDLTEWGSLAEPPPPPPSPKPDPKAAPAASGKSPAQPGSHVAIAFDDQGATLAAEVMGDAAQGIWVGLSLGSPEFPPIGMWLRYGGIQEMNCEVYENGEPRSEEDAKDCQSILSAHEEFKAEHTARFHTFYKLDSRGVHTPGPEGSLVPVDGAQLAFKTTEKGCGLEVRIPALALPRTQQAPLADIGAIARIHPLNTPPTIAPENWLGLSLEVPVGFEPYAAIRKAIFEASMTSRLVAQRTLSYQPGEPLRVEDLGYPLGNTYVVESKPHVLYSQQATLGDVEVGYAYTGLEAVFVMKGGKPTSVVEITGNVRSIQKRGDELHVFSYERYSPPDDMGADTAKWYVIGVKPDGEAYEGLVDLTDVPFRWGQGEIVESHSPDFSTFSIAGYGPSDGMGNDESPTYYDVTWMWQKDAGMYVPKVKEGGKPKKKVAPQNVPKTPKPLPKNKTQAK